MVTATASSTSRASSTHAGRRCGRAVELEVGAGVAELVEVEDVQDGKATGGRGEGAACARQRRAHGHQEQDDERKRGSGVALLSLRSLEELLLLVFCV
jgi:hypothetical protein